MTSDHARRDAAQTASDQGLRAKRGSRGDRARSQRAVLAAFDAFRQRHYQPYLEYALLRLGRSAAAESAVSAAFTELAVSWHLVLGSPEPAAIAWRILHEHVDNALGPAARVADEPRRGALRRDACLLHDEMHLSCERTAEVLGICQADLVGLLAPAGCPKE
ncbi:hypothetical protein [Streptomyces sp. NPDC052114]|uniref:hypothetical protein n=1 Tax=unclassified Streptomyces TaxID=2593676 RepID=UPI003432F235